MRTFRLAFGFAMAVVLAAGAAADARIGAKDGPLSAQPGSEANAAEEPTGAAHPPALNHVYVVLDAGTYAAIRESLDLSGMLGRSDGGLPDYAPPAPDADRIFFRGRQTYLEFFAPDNRFREPVGKVGWHWAMTSQCGSKRWNRHGAPCAATRHGVLVSNSRGPSLRCRGMTRCSATTPRQGPHLAVWAMVYRPEFHRWQSGAGTDVPPRVARADVLAGRLAAGQGRFDITALEINVGTSLHAKLVRQLERAGFEREDGPTGTRLRGDGWALLLREVNKEPGLVSISVTTDTRLPNDLLLGSARMVQRSNGNVDLQFGKLVIE